LKFNRDKKLSEVSFQRTSQPTGRFTDVKDGLAVTTKTLGIKLQSQVKKRAEKGKVPFRRSDCYKRGIKTLKESLTLPEAGNGGRKGHGGKATGRDGHFWIVYQKKRRKEDGINTSTGRSIHGEGFTVCVATCVF